MAGAGADRRLSLLRSPPDSGTGPLTGQQERVINITH